MAVMESLLVWRLHTRLGLVDELGQIFPYVGFLCPSPLMSPDQFVCVVGEANSGVCDYIRHKNELQLPYLISSLASFSSRYMKYAAD